MIPRTVLCEEHFGKPVLREAEPIELARVPVNGDRLQDSIILHPRYIPLGVDHELFSARVYRRGRTVDLFLEEPVEIAGEEYGILNFKGVGADADDELLIDTDKWYDPRCGDWTPRVERDRFGRVWGALTLEWGQDEFTAEIFHTYGIKHIPHVALNSIPQKVTDKIRRLSHGSERHDLAQLVRACKTNVRLNDFLKANEGRKYQVYNTEWVKRIAQIDAAIINAQINLGRRGKRLHFQGSLADNRFIDGSFTDVENYGYRDFYPFDAVVYIQEVVNSSLRMLLPPDISHYCGDL